MDYITSNSYDGQIRKLFKIFCIRCKKEIYIPKHRLTNKNYCSLLCRSLASRNRVTLICALCKIDFERTVNKVTAATHGYSFCSRKCKDAAQRVGGIVAIQPSHYKDGLSKYRERAFKAYGKICNVCSYNKFVEMLEVDHIDSNRKHNEIDNLMVLCVWCHVFKTRLGRLPIKNLETSTFK